MDIKELQNDLQAAVKMLREYGDRAEAEKKQYGEALAETKQAIERLNDRIDQLETELKRPQGGGASKGEPDLRKKAFFRYLAHGKGELAPEERKALVEDASGQILVPEDLEAGIISELPKLTVVRGLTTVLPTGSDRVRRRSLADVSVGWGKLETGTALTDSMPSTPGEAYLYVEDLYGLAKIGEDELDDTDVALEQWLQSTFARVIAETEDDAFIAGTGHANSQPEGILNGTTVTRVTFGQAAAITADDLIELEYAVPAQYRRNAAFIMATSTEKAVRLLKDGNGQYLWKPGLVRGEPSTFDGYPIYNQDAVPAIPAAGTAADVAIFGDLRAGYQIRDRRGMTVQRLSELYAEAGMVGFKVRYRVGGAVVRANALRVGQVPA